MHVSLDDGGRWQVDTVVEGDTVRDVLGYVQYDADELRGRLGRDVEVAVEGQRLASVEGASLIRLLDESLEGYTYLD